MAASCAALRWSALLCLPLHVAGKCEIDQLIRQLTFHVVARHRHTPWQCVGRVQGRATLNDSQNSEWLIMQFGSEPFGLMRSLSLSFMHSFTHSLHLFLTADAAVNSNAAGPPLWGASDKQTGTGSRSESQSGRSRQKEKKKKRSKSKRSRSSCK